MNGLTGNRTQNLRIKSPVLCQLSYKPLESVLPTFKDARGLVRGLEAPLTDCEGLSHNLDDEVENLGAVYRSRRVQGDNVG